jgi:hypothetical protein
LDTELAELSLREASATRVVAFIAPSPVFLLR